MNVEGVFFRLKITDWCQGQGGHTLSVESENPQGKPIRLVQDIREGSMGATVFETNITLENYKPTFYLDNTVSFH